MHLKRTVLWIFAIIALAAAVFFLGWEEIKGILLQANPYVLAVLCLLQVGTLAMSAYMWHFLMRKLAPGYSFGRVFAVYLGGNFVESITPAAKMGGEAARIYLFRRLTSLPYTKLAGVLLVHKYISLLPFVLLCTFMLPLSLFLLKLPPFFIPAFIALIGLFAAVVILLRARHSSHSKGKKSSSSELPEWQQKWNRVFLFLKDAASQARTLTTRREQLVLLAISLCVWALYPLKVYLVATMLGLRVDMVVAAMATYSAYMISMIPLLPGGLGTFEGSMAFIFAFSGLAPAAGLAIALLTRLVTYWFSLLLTAVAAATLALGNNPLPGAAGRPDSLRGPPEGNGWVATEN